MEEIRYRPIGVIHSPFTSRKEMPIQPSGAAGVAGSVELSHELLPGLKDLNGFSHIILIYHFHLSDGYELDVAPFLDDRKHGLFATRAPRRPNPIGLSVVKLLRVRGHILDVENIDVLDGTPLLDIKPYVSSFDNVQGEKIGWVTQTVEQSRTRRSDDRFV